MTDDNSFPNSQKLLILKFYRSYPVHLQKTSIVNNSINLETFMEQNKMASNPPQNGPQTTTEPNLHKYQFISYQIRKSLIQMVFEKGFTVYRAAKLLNLNQSTAKAIARKYRSQGTIFRRKQETEEHTHISPRIPLEQNLRPVLQPKNTINTGFVRVSEPSVNVPSSIEPCQRIYLMMPYGAPPSSFAFQPYPFGPMI